MSERAPVSTAETAAHSNARAGYRSPAASRGSATSIRKRRRSATSLGVRGSVGEPTCSTAEGMGDGQARSRSVLMGLDNHTRPANRTNLNRAMPLATARPCRGSPWRTSPATGRTSPGRGGVRRLLRRLARRLTRTIEDDPGQAAPRWSGSRRVPGHFQRDVQDGGCPSASLATTPDGPVERAVRRRAAPPRWWAATMGEPGLGEGLVDGVGEDASFLQQRD